MCLKPHIIHVPTLKANMNIQEELLDMAVNFKPNPETIPFSNVYSGSGSCANPINLNWTNFPKYIPLCVQQVPSPRRSVLPGVVSMVRVWGAVSCHLALMFHFCRGSKRPRSIRCLKYAQTSNCTRHLRTPSGFRGTYVLCINVQGKQKAKKQKSNGWSWFALCSFVRFCWILLYWISIQAVQHVGLLKEAIPTPFWNALWHLDGGWNWNWNMPTMATNRVFRLRWLLHPPM